MIIPAKVAYAIGALVTTFLVTTQAVVDDIFSSVSHIRLPGPLRILGAPLRISLDLFTRPRPILSPPIISSPIIPHVPLAAPTPAPFPILMNITPAQSMTMDLVPYPTTALAIYNPDPLATAAAIQAPVTQVTQIFSTKVGQVTSIVPWSYPTSVLAPPTKTYPAADALVVFSFLTIIWTFYILIEFMRKGRRSNTQVTAEEEINNALRIRTPPLSFYVFTSPNSLWDSMAVGCSESCIFPSNDSFNVDMKLFVSPPLLSPPTLASPSMSQFPVANRGRTHSTSLALAALASSVQVKDLRSTPESTLSLSIEAHSTSLPLSVSASPDVPQTVTSSPDVSANTTVSPALSLLGLGISCDDVSHMDLYHRFDDISILGPFSREDYIPSVILEDELPALSPELPDEVIYVLREPMLLITSPNDSVHELTSLLASDGTASYLTELDAVSDVPDVAPEAVSCPEAGERDSVATSEPSDHSFLDDCPFDTAALDLAYPALITVDSAPSSIDLLIHVTTPPIFFTAASGSDDAVVTTGVLDACTPVEDGSSLTAFRGLIEPDTPLVSILATPMVSSPSLSYLADDFASSLDALAESLSAMSLDPVPDAPGAEYPRPEYCVMQDEGLMEKPMKLLVGLGIFPEVIIPIGSVDPVMDEVDEYVEDDLLSSDDVANVEPCMVPLPVSVPSLPEWRLASTQVAASEEVDAASIPLPSSPSPSPVSCVADPASISLPASPVEETTVIAPASIPLPLSPMLASAYVDSTPVSLPDELVLPASVDAPSILPSPSLYADAASVPLPPSPSLDPTTVPLPPSLHGNPGSIPLPDSPISVIEVIELVPQSLPDLLILTPSIVDPAVIPLPPSPLLVDPAFIALPPSPLLVVNPVDSILVPLLPSSLAGSVHVDPVSVPLPPSSVADPITIPLPPSPLFGFVYVESTSVPLPPSLILDPTTIPLPPSPCVDLMPTPVALLPPTDPISIPLPPSPCIDPTLVSLLLSPSSASDVAGPASIPLPGLPPLIPTSIDTADIPLLPSPDVDSASIPEHLSSYLSAPYLGSPTIPATVYGLGIHPDPSVPLASPAAGHNIDNFAATTTDATYLFATYTASVKMPVTTNAMSVSPFSDVSIDLVPFPADFATSLLDDSSTIFLTASPVVPSLSSSALSPAQVSVDIGPRTVVEDLWKPPLLTSPSQSDTKNDVKIDFDADSLQVIEDVPCTGKAGVPLSSMVATTTSMTFSDSNILAEHEDEKGWTIVTHRKDRAAPPSPAPSSIFDSLSVTSAIDEDSYEVSYIDEWSLLDDDDFEYYSFSCKLVPLGPAPAHPATAISSITRPWNSVSSVPAPPWVQHVELLVDMITPSKTAHARVLPPLPQDHRPAGPAVDVNGPESGRPRRKRTRRGQGKKRQEAALKASVLVAGMVHEYRGGVQKAVPEKNAVIGRRTHLVRRQQRTQRVQQPPNNLALWTVYEEPPSQEEAVVCADGPRRLDCNDDSRASSLGLSRLVTLDELINVIATPKVPRKPRRGHQLLLL